MPGDNIKDYTIIKIIGEGRYGIAYLCEKNSNEKYVIKQLKEDMVEKSKEKLFYEEEIMKYLDDKRFPKFIEKFDFDNTKYYVVEFVNGKDFYDLLTFDEYEFSKNEIYDIAQRVLNIIIALQEKNIVHRDIRISNVIMNENKDLVLIDFGLARYIDNNRYKKEIDYWYMADFLLHLYYSSFDDEGIEQEDRPWYEELDLDNEEINFLKRLMGIEKSYENTDEIRTDLLKIKNKKTCR
ncbi:protein kinase domain-containing protein [Paraclostridium sordellii]|uniref:protein kinase domain-containing protein n=1 Tax=Paraclostridium sordellii TaxID=1505 RepID=UPI0005DC789F|nr:protein kinase [Paeniclostridium sordellii]CEN77884.1 serine/threonine protein kinase [[Clostridium] sordellii] [Paeniclostridium sordellii]